MRALLLGLAALGLLSGCRDDPPAASASDGPPARLMPNTPSASTVKEQCDAHDLAYLVGKPHTQIPVPVDPSKRRVACSTCALADDYRPDRTDILFDSETGLVLSVTCG